MTEQELRQDFVDVAISYLNSKEGSAKHKEIIDTYNKIVPLPRGYKLKYTDPWCAGSVSAWAAMRDLLDIIPAECSCNKQIELWKKIGRWMEQDSYVPKIGDILYFDWQDSGSGDNKGSSDHVGIVVSVSGKQLKIIEGNKNDSVEYRSMTVNGKFIRGYGLPDFASKATEKDSSDTDNLPSKEMCNVELPILKKNSKGESVKALQALLVGFGYSCGSAGIDGDFGSGTEKAVKKYQKANKLSQDGIVGEKTWASLLK